MAKLPLVDAASNLGASGLLPNFSTVSATPPVSPMLDLSTAFQELLIAGARDAAPVRGLTHGYYKYPARFSPEFAHVVIKAFTKPGDLVLDNHVGGGTTLVEALALGRDGIGVDISSLAEFVATVKPPSSMTMSLSD